MVRTRGRPGDPTPSLVVTVALAAVLVMAGVAPVGGEIAAQADGTPSCSFPRAGETTVEGPQPALDIGATRIPGRSASIRYTIRFDLPGGTERFAARPWRTSWIDRVSNLRIRGDRLVWTGEGAPRVTLSVPASDAGRGWVTGHAPLVAYRWTRGDRSRCTHATAPTTPASITATGDDDITLSTSRAFLSDGTHTDWRVRAGGTQYRLVADETAVGERFDQGRALAAIERTAATLDLNASVSRVTVFALPPGASDTARTTWLTWNGSSRTVYLASSEPVEGPDSAWIHEVVHTRQDFDVGPRLAWLVEASSRYYAVRLGGGNTISPGRFSAPTPADDVRLAAPETWRPTTPYEQGAAVLRGLDHRLRSASAGTHSVRSILAWLTRQDGRVTYPAFRRAVVTRSNRSVGRWLDRHVEVRAPPG